MEAEIEELKLEVEHLRELVNYLLDRLHQADEESTQMENKLRKQLVATKMLLILPAEGEV